MFTSNPPTGRLSAVATSREFALDLQRVAIEVGLEAAAHVRRRRVELYSGPREPDFASTKSSPTDPVTIVDTESEEVIRKALNSRRPGDSVLGEEGGGPANTDAAVQWVVDPIDGTVNFMYGLPAYAVSIAAAHQGVFVAGAVADVNSGETYTAALGAGAHRISPTGEWTPLRVNTPSSLQMSLVATGFGYAASRRAEQGRIVAGLLPHVRDIRRLGSAALDLCLLAAGQVDAYYEHGLNVWDWAAGALIAQEAGAAVELPAADAAGNAGHIVAASAPSVAEAFANTLRDLNAVGPIPV
ncbi:inositol monophosphatase family protein [Smaragdicoccus niigatensis]|uniref:inositol monophosphatase family protein n=1 Tax=Smaragdicoccus niigatensis TaxID=359359 RepID=UPI00036B05A5|nr:inositol monophosphatase family protein [Smaragdicoccus niigatensis]